MVYRDFDELLVALGGHGTYQKRMLALVIVPTSFFIGFSINLLLFQMAIPDHWCHTAGRERTTLSEEQWKNITIPRDTLGEYSGCSRYILQWDDEGDGNPYLLTNETQACTDGWDFDKSEFQTTMATSLEWFCEQSEYSNYIFSVTSAGNAVGTFVLPVISDQYTGRRPMFFLTLILTVVFTLPLIWLPYFTAHVLLRFIAGLAFETNYQMPFLIVLEVLSPDKRAMASCLSFAAWTIGMCCASLVAWLIPRWDYLAFISCVPAAVGFAYWWFLPESPRWLLARGKISECADILTKIADVNSRPLPCKDDLKTELKLLNNQEEEIVALSQIVKYKKLFVRTILLHILFFTCYAVYGILLLSMNVLASNFFLSHFVLSAFELPSNVLGWLLTHYLGRRFTCLSTTILIGVFSVSAYFCTHDKWAMLAVVGFIKLFSTQFIYILIVMATEVLPTPVRATGLAWMTVCGLLAVSFSPYALTTGYGETFQYWLILGVSIVSLVLSWPLPETLGLPLPQTFQDAEDIAVGRPLKSWIHHWNCKDYPSRMHEKCEPDELKHMNSSSKSS